MRTKQLVLATIFTAWWAVNGIMIVWMVTAGKLSAIALILLGFFGAIINFALNFHVRDITSIYHQQASRLIDIQEQAGIRPPTQYNWWGWLTTRRIYLVIGILLIIWWIFIFSLGLAMVVLDIPLWTMMPSPAP